MKRSAQTIARAMLDVLERQTQADEVNAQHVINEMNLLVAKKNETPVAEIRSAHQLSEQSLKQITSFLKKKLTLKKIEVNPVIDPTILGGFIAHVGDTHFDFSIRSALMHVRDYV